ncbi:MULTISPECIES: hypothetical protein [Streptomyces]|nr:hypothetical protein [Streptomyces sp. FXJ1.172]WEP00563.1 hypothetical protein A6P39_043280 [Streptomyces sp. FXJ1.172]
MTGATAVLALILLKLSPRQPMFRYYTVACTARLVATVLVEAV